MVCARYVKTSENKWDPFGWDHTQINQMSPSPYTCPLNLTSLFT